MNSYPSDRNWTYPSLRQALLDHKVLLRVHTSPKSPLPSPANDPSTAGFTARNAAFRGLAPQEFRQVTARLRTEEGWANGPYMRKTIIDHLNNSTTARPRLSQPPGRPFYPHSKTQNGYRGGRVPAPSPVRHPISQARFEADEQSPWISTTEKLDWAIWYISKLLAQGRHKQVHLAIIKNGARHGEISIKPFRTHEREREREREREQCPSQPRHPSQSRPETMGLEGISMDAYRRARTTAIMCREILLYGRIFGESIISDLTFTPYGLPFGLPLQFWNPIEQSDPSRQGWLARLRFHPLLLNFLMSMENVNRPPPPRGRGSWSIQPVNPNLQHHAHNHKIVIVEPHFQIHAGGPRTQARDHHDHSRAIRTSPPGLDQHGHTRPQEEEEGDDDDEEEDEYTIAIEGMLVDLTIPDLSV